MKITIAISLMIWTASICSASAQPTTDVREAVRIVMLLCAAGGERSTSKLEIDAEGGSGPGAVLKRFDAEGKIKERILLDETQANGLVDGLNSLTDKVSAEQANKARDCMKPYIERLLDLILIKSEGNAVEILISKINKHLFSDGVTISKDKITIKSGTWAYTAKISDLSKDLKEEKSTMGTIYSDDTWTVYHLDLDCMQKGCWFGKGSWNGKVEYDRSDYKRITFSVEDKSKKIPEDLIRLIRTVK